MIDEVDAALKALLKEEALGGADVEVVFDAPTKDWAARRNAPTVNAYLYDIREDTRKRTRGMINEYNAEGVVVGRHLPPRFYNLSYLVTAWTQRPEDEHRLLAQMLVMFSSYDAMPRERLNGQVGSLRLPVEMRVSQPPPEDRSFADVWTALGGELKPSIDIVLSVPLTPARVFEAGPPVYEGPVITLADVDGDGIDEHRRRMSVAGEGAVPPPTPIGGSAGAGSSTGRRDARDRAAGRGGSAAGAGSGQGSGGGDLAAGLDPEARLQAARAEAARRAAQRDGVSAEPGAEPGRAGSNDAAASSGPTTGPDAVDRPAGGGGIRRTRRGAPSRAIAGDSVWSPWTEQPDAGPDSAGGVESSGAGEPQGSSAAADPKPDPKPDPKAAPKAPEAKKAGAATKRKPAGPA